MDTYTVVVTYATADDTDTGRVTYYVVASDRADAKREALTRFGMRRNGERWISVTPSI